MFLATPEMMRCSAFQEDEGRLAILSLVTIAACVSVVAVGFIPHSKETVNTVFLMHLGVAIFTIVGSWLFLIDEKNLSVTSGCETVVD